MHFFNINLGIAGSLRDKNFRLLNLCGLLCLAILLKGQMATGVVGHVFEHQAIGQGQVGGNDLVAPAHSITLYRSPSFFFDFETAPELDPEPTGQNGEIGKGNTRTGLPLLLLSSVEQRRTKSTLAYCASSLQKRIVVPLFVLHHAWKHFPA